MLQHAAARSNTMQNTAAQYSTWQHTKLDPTHKLWNMRGDSFICDTTHWYVVWLIHIWHDSFVSGVAHLCMTWLIHVRHDWVVRGMTRSCGAWIKFYIQRLNITWLIHMSNNSFMTPSHVTCLSHMRPVSFKRDTTRHVTNRLLLVTLVTGVAACRKSRVSWRVACVVTCRECRDVPRVVTGVATCRLLSRDMLRDWCRDSLLRADYTL